MSVLQNQDCWWGEGDDMFFIDGEEKPSTNGTGSEDYFLGAWGFNGHAFSYATYGALVVGPEFAGSRTSVYRFHLDSPIPFTKSLKATIEHGHANHRSDNYSSVAYWYQRSRMPRFRRCRRWSKEFRGFISSAGRAIPQIKGVRPYFAFTSNVMVSVFAEPGPTIRSNSPGSTT